MKILIYSLPRAGSHFLHGKLNRYLKNLGGMPILDYDGSRRKKWWTGPEWGYAISKVESNIVFFKKDSSMNNMKTLLANRIPHLDSIHNICLKFHYYDGIGELEREFASHFDKVIILKRRDLFERSLSEMFCNFSGYWNFPNETRPELLLKLKDNKIHINELHWRIAIERYKNPGYLMPTISGTEVFFEDLINVSDAKQFCEMVNLPYLDFSIQHSPSDGPSLEIGTAKYDMISNINELKEIYDEVIKTI